MVDISTNITIGDIVQVKFPIRVVSFSEFALEVEVRCGNVFDYEIIYVPRFISALGQFIPGQNWHIPVGAFKLADDFCYTGKYYIDDRLYVARQLSQEEADAHIESYTDQVLDGAVLIGAVVYIYAEYYIKGQEKLPTDVEFFDNTDEATHDFYANEVYAIIQDNGSDVEYPVNIKFLKTL
jgi:hypothetical protein